MNGQQPPDDITKNKKYALAILLVAIISAISQTLVVPPAWKLWPAEEPRAQTSPTPAATPIQNRPNVCGIWVSSTSQKRYDFVCQGGDSFEIYEVSDQGINKNGSGKLTEGSKVEAEILSTPKNRKARLKLMLSTDGRRMEGSWKGDDPRESGQLMFHRI